MFSLPVPAPVASRQRVAFARQGHRVTVLERQPALQSPGGPLTIQSAASKCLYFVGAKEALEKNSIPMDTMIWWSHKEDQPISIVQFPDISQTPRHRVNRPLIQELMYHLAVEAGVKVFFGKNVVRVAEEPEKLQAWTQDGAEWPADLIVGADGMPHDQFSGNPVIIAHAKVFYQVSSPAFGGSSSHRKTWKVSRPRNASF